MSNADLEARLLAAHKADDRTALAALYQCAAQQAPDENARAFYLVHAYVFALETNHLDRENIRGQLQRMGREV